MKTIFVALVLLAFAGTAQAQQRLPRLGEGVQVLTPPAAAPRQNYGRQQNNLGRPLRRTQPLYQLPVAPRQPQPRTRVCQQQGDFEYCFGAN